MEAEQCGSCRFFLKNPPQEGDGDVVTGSCRRGPPLPIASNWIQMFEAIQKPGVPPQISFGVTNIAAMFPTMLESGWCGCFEAVGQSSMN